MSLTTKKTMMRMIPKAINYHEDHLYHHPFFNFFLTKTRGVVPMLLTIMIALKLNSLPVTQSFIANSNTFHISPKLSSKGQRQQKQHQTLKQEINNFRQLQKQEQQLQQIRFYSMLENKKEDNDDDDAKKPGMDDAFRQLDELLKSSTKPEAKIPAETPKIKVPLDKVEKVLKEVVTDGTTTASSVLPVVSLEKEMETYKDMLQEVERNEEINAYHEIVNELGGSTQPTIFPTDDVYTDIILDLGGTPSIKSTITPATVQIKSDVIIQNKKTKDLNDNYNVDDIMNAALDEALKEVTIQNKQSTKSILDDKEIMKEIEAIFERGNEKLIESLNEIRIEQVCVDI